MDEKSEDILKESEDILKDTTPERHRDECVAEVRQRNGKKGAWAFRDGMAFGPMSVTSITNH